MVSRARLSVVVMVAPDSPSVSVCVGFRRRVDCHVPWWVKV